jgi:hypothetical protein
VIRANIENVRRRGAIVALRLAGKSLRYATLLHRQGRISHHGLRTVLSGARWLERLGAFLALGRRRKNRKSGEDF